MCRPFPAALAPAVFVEPTTLQSGEVTLRELSTLSTECNNTTVHKQTPVRCPYDVIAASSTVSPPPYSASTSLASALASASTPGQVAALSSTASPLPSSSSATLTSASASTSDYVPVSCAPASASTVDPSNSFSQVAGTSSGRLPYTRGSGAPDKTLQVATIPKLKNVHVFNLANNCTCDTVKQFILNKIKNKRINVSQVNSAFATLRRFRFESTQEAAKLRFGRFSSILVQLSETVVLGGPGSSIIKSICQCLLAIGQRESRLTG
ncbi:uncharacterized protein LOC143921300 [Arctopsyche grandis]|uniref:uncharacterized protein LOC143921300 n=1 Tax=Arctopsyche grandis TaxID=121162 RepID=UPI00406DA365